MKKFGFSMLALLIAASGVAVIDDVHAASQSVTANISFDTPLAITKVTDIRFGSVLAGTADTYTITTAGAVVAAGAGQWLAGTKSAGNILIAGSATQLINISAGGYVANGGVTLANATCAYNGGSAGSCTLTGAAAPGTGKTLLIGVDAAVDGSQAAGASATPSLTITVVYQ